MSNQVSLFKRVVNTLIEARERAVQRHVRQYLRGLSDRQITDMGFSRELLEQGPKAWPWRAPVEPSTAALWGQERKGIAHAAKYAQPSDRPVTADDKLAA